MNQKEDDNDTTVDLSSTKFHFISLSTKVFLYLFVLVIWCKMRLLAARIMQS